MQMMGARADAAPGTAAQGPRPNIVLIVSGDIGHGDLARHDGGPRPRLPTPNIDRLASEGMSLRSFYSQPGSTPCHAAIQTGRLPIRSGMADPVLPGPEDGLPAEEWTLASVLKTAGYKTFFTGKWHLGEADASLPNAHGYDEMKYASVHCLDASARAGAHWLPEPADLRSVLQRVTKGVRSGLAGQKAREDFKVNAEYVDTPVLDGKPGLVGTPFFDSYVERASLDFLHRNARAAAPFFMSINFAKARQPNLPHPDYIGQSGTGSRHADSVVELDARIGRIMARLRELGLDRNTLVFWTTDNGAWQDICLDAGTSSYCGARSAVREGGNRVPAIAWMPGRIAAGSRSDELAGGLDLMATFASIGGARLPTNDRAHRPILFDSIDMSPVLFGQGRSARRSWFYFIDNGLTPAAARVGNYKAVFGQPTDSGARDPALVTPVFDLHADPQEHQGIVTSCLTERVWTLVTINAAVRDLMKSHAKYPPRKRRCDTEGGTPRALPAPISGHWPRPAAEWVLTHGAGPGPVQRPQ
ncbi:MAG: sulfatase-like hydrolase/transferase [Variovorax sp.]